MLDGSKVNRVTGGYICAKVRRFPERMYGPDRVLYPAVRKGPKGSGWFERVSWDDALTRIADRLRAVRDEFGGEAILPYSYGGSNGLLTQDTSDAALFRRLGASRLARTVCAAATGAANQTLYGKMPSVVYEDFPEARLIILWGVNPSASGIHLVPYLREAQKRGARLVVVDPRTTPLAKQADLHLPVRPGTDLPVALSIHRYLFEEGRADQAFLEAHTRNAERLRERAAKWTFACAAAEADVPAADIERLAQWYAEASPALIRCGWGQERNRNGGSSSMAILALPAVAGKFGVRGGGYAMSNSNAWGIERTWIRDQEPPTRLVNMNQLGRALTEYPIRRSRRCSSTTRTPPSPRRTRPRCCRGSSARICSRSSSSRRSPTRRATPTSCCRRRRFSKATTSCAATDRSACASGGRSSSRSANRGRTPTSSASC